MLWHGHNGTGCSCLYGGRALFTGEYRHGTKYFVFTDFTHFDTIGKYIGFTTDDGVDVFSFIPFFDDDVAGLAILESSSWTLLAFAQLCHLIQQQAVLAQ